MYVSCTKTATNAWTSGSCSYTLPATLAAGNYELRLFSNDSYTRLATSSSFSVSQPVASPVSQPFSFSLANSGDKSVIAGSSVTNSIAATLVSGNSQPVSFSISGLPSGATGSFSSTPCNPSCSTVLNIVTIGSTPAGNFPITVTSTGGGVTKTTAFTLSVTLALTVAPPAIPATSGVTRYADGQLSSNCTSGNYSIAKRDCTGKDGNAYKSLQDASNASAPGDTILVRSFSGIYTGTGEHGQVMPKPGTSVTNRTILWGYQNELPIINGLSEAHFVHAKNLILDLINARKDSIGIFGGH